MSALWAVLPAAGSGSRFGGERPKQFLHLGERSVLEWSVLALLKAVTIEGMTIAVPPDTNNSLERSGLLGGALSDRRVAFCSGGTTRAASVAAGLAALQADAADWVLVHDAARPCVPRSDIRRLVEKVRGDGVGGILAVPVTDTLKRADTEGRVEKTMDRSSLWRALTPQMFRVGELTQALEQGVAAGREITDEASAMEAAGYPVQLVPGSAANIKITYTDDLPLAEFWMRQEASTI